jgi:hypothetical protein
LRRVPLALFIGLGVVVASVVRSGHGDQAGAIAAILIAVIGGPLLFVVVPILNTFLRNHWPAWKDLWRKHE